MNSAKRIPKKYFVWIPATIPFVGGTFLYYKRDYAVENSLTNDDYIYLPSVYDFNSEDDIVMLRNNDSLPSKQDKLTTHKPVSKLNYNNNNIYNLFNELNALKLAQSYNYEQSLALARTPNIDPNLFRFPIKTNKILIRINQEVCHFELDELMTHLLKCVIQIKENKSERAKYFTEQSLVLFEKEVDLNDIFFNNEYGRKLFDRTLIKRYQGFYFQAILESLICDKAHALCLLDNGLLILFHRLRELYLDDEIQGWISNCISALSVYEEAHRHLYHTGWIRILVEWLNSPNLKLSLEAAKTLYNMSNKDKLHNSVYVLHPIYHTNLTQTDCDIIFIHGLKGGVFKTWRQADIMKNLDDYTECWPKTWLGSDFNNSRILAINYQTFLSNWNINCSSDMFTFKERSVELAKELKLANVGQRPIIWVTHSMGGLLVKQMLSDIDQNNSLDKSLLKNTKGIVFYSVPHKGTEMAVWSPNIQKIISPSNHVLELRKDSPSLLDLNDNFTDVVKRNKIECLSFGESKKSTLLRKPFEWKTLLVQPESADPGIGQFILFSEDHFNICKPSDKQSDSYKKLKEFIGKLIIKKKTEHVVDHLEQMQNHMLTFFL